MSDERPVILTPGGALGALLRAVREEFRPEPPPPPTTAVVDRRRVVRRCADYLGSFDERTQMSRAYWIVLGTALAGAVLAVVLR